MNANELNEDFKSIDHDPPKPSNFFRKMIKMQSISLTIIIKT